MDYLCNETTIASPVSGIAMTERYIATFHHATLRVFDHSFNLIFERYLYEKILAIRKLGDREIIVLFRGNRAAQMTFELETVALRTVQGTSMDVHTIGGGKGSIAKSLVLVWNRSEATVFSESSEEHQIIRFGKLEIQNVNQVIFLQNYIPTLLILWKSTTSTRCTMVALDGIEIIESFDVVDGVITVHSLGRYIIILSRHFIQIRFKRETSTLELGYIAAPPDASVIYRAVEHLTGGITLENPQLVLIGDALVLINGDGEVYRIILDSDATRITSVRVLHGGKMVVPSCADTCKAMCVVGSYEGPTLLCTLESEDSPLVSNKSKTGKGDTPTVPGFMKLVSMLNNVGAITSFHAQKDGNLVFATKPRMLIALSVINFQVHERVKLPFQLDRLFTKSDGIYGEGADGVVQIVKSAVKCSPYRALRGDDGLLSIHASDSPVKKLFDVHCWHSDGSMLAYTTVNSLVLYSMSSNKRIFYTTNICKFEEKIVNETFFTSSNLIEFTDVPADGEEGNMVGAALETKCDEDGKQKDTEEKQSDKIIEILVRDGDYPFIFLRTIKQLFIYKKVGNILIKVFIPRYLSFDTQQSMFCMGRYVYLRSRTPYMVFLEGGVFMHASNCRFAMGVADGDTFYFVYKGYLVKSKLPGLESGTEYFSNSILQCIANDESSSTPEDVRTVASDLEIERVKRRKSEKENSKFVTEALSVEKTGENEEKKHEHRFDDEYIIQDNSQSDNCPRRVACINNHLVVATAHFSSFTYEPFIPMVHISHGPGSAPVSEPINKEQETFSGPLILGRTLKYSLELRSQDCALYHTVELEENELVCDLKILLDGLVVVCTSFPEGEEKAVRGRIIVFAIRDVVPDPSFPWRDKQLCLIASEPVKAPCLAVTEVRGFLAVCVGTRLMVYDVDTTTGMTAAHRSTGLLAIGRNEIALLTMGIIAIENLIAVVDRHRGIRLFFLRPKDPLRLHLLSQGDPILRATHIQYIVYPSEKYDLLSFVVRDAFGTLHVYTYSPQYPLSGNGTRLIKRAEVRTGISGRFTDSNTIHHNNSRIYSSAFISDSIMFSVHAMGSSRALILQAAIAAHVIVPGGIDVRSYLEPGGYVNMECREVASSRVLLEFFFMDTETQKAVLQMANLEWDKAMMIYQMVFNE